MTKFSNFSFKPRLNWTVLQTLLISTVLTTFLTSIIFSNTKVYADENIRKGELMRYARIVIKMEKPRQEAYDEIKKIYRNREIPNIVCNNPTSFGELPGRAREIASNYCKRSREIVEGHGLSIERFNKITEAAKKDGKIKSLIYDALIREQGGRKNR